MLLRDKCSHCYSVETEKEKERSTNNQRITGKLEMHEIQCHVYRVHAFIQTILVCWEVKVLQHAVKKKEHSIFGLNIYHGRKRVNETRKTGVPEQNVGQMTTGAYRWRRGVQYKWTCSGSFGT